MTTPPPPSQSSRLVRFRAFITGTVADPGCPTCGHVTTAADMLHALAHGPRTVVGGSWVQAPIVPCPECGELRAFRRRSQPLRMMAALTVAGGMAALCVVAGTAAGGKHSLDVGLTAAIAVFGVVMFVANAYVTTFEPVSAKVAEATRTSNRKAIGAVFALMAAIVMYRLLR